MDEPATTPHLHIPAVSDSIVTVSCLKHIYPDTTEIHMCGLDFVVERGERVVVLGGNGSGKTTLLYHLLGLLKPDEGKVTVFGKDPSTEYSAIRERIGVQLQNVEEQILSPTVREDVSFSPRNYGIGREETARMVDAVMAELGIVHLQDKICHYLSGGEKRKVALAGALVMRPELLILDEPFEGLIEDQKLRPHDQRARKGDLAFFAARQIVADLVLQMDDPEFCHHSIDHSGRFLPADAVIARRERDVLPYRGRQDLFLHVLQLHADPFADRAVLRRRVLAEDRDLPLVRFQQAQQMIQERGLSRSVPAQHHHPLPALHHEVEAAHVDLRGVRIDMLETADGHNAVADGRNMQMRGRRWFVHAISRSARRSARPCRPQSAASPRGPALRPRYPPCCRYSPARS